MAEKFKMMKVFKNGSMPTKIRKAFMENVEGRSNDCFVRIGEVGESSLITENELKDYPDAKPVFHECFGGDKYFYARDIDIVSDWLLDNGVELMEEVLIEHSW